MRATIAGIVCFSLLAIPAAIWSKGLIVRIVIEGDGLPVPVDIRDPDILGQFNIWNGPGVVTRGPDGIPHPPAYLDSTPSAGWFIDWPEGVASERPPGLQRLEITFHIGVPMEPNEIREYIFAYEVDSSKSRGYIYLPRWKNDLIYHGVEGNWFYASERWDEAMMPLVAARSSDAAVARRNTKCTVGTGSAEPGGTLVFGLADENGNIIARRRYEPDYEEYGSIKEHIGNVQPGEEFEVSCWPPRT